MEKPDSVMYKGERYRLQSTGRYYQSDDRFAPNRLLHRRVWVDHYGPIPDGMHVHHINGNWADNRIENLELVNAKEHQSYHMRERFKDPVFRERNNLVLKVAQEGAKKWHASEDGLKWHAEHGKKTWEGREPVKATCSVCGKEYETFFPSRSRFCSRACEKREGYVRNKTATGICAYCGKEFVYNKYRNQRCCSRTCANRLRVVEQKAKVCA